MCNAPPPGPRRASTRKVGPPAAAAASGSAVCGAAVHGAWFALTPCFGSMGLLLIGLAALHACPSWPVWTLVFGGYFIRHRTTRLV